MNPARPDKPIEPTDEKGKTSARLLKKLRENRESTRRIGQVAGEEPQPPTVPAPSLAQSFLKLFEDELREDGGDEVPAGYDDLFLCETLGAIGLNDLESELVSLRREIDAEAKSIMSLEAGAEEKTRRIERLQSSLEALAEKERLTHFLPRVHEKAGRLLTESAEFRDGFDRPCFHAYVMSVDIRRSTELMLKARSAVDFARFITSLCDELKRIVVSHFGVFDKFTGDGVIAYFPESFAGPDAALHAVLAAAECHEAFRAIYESHRGAFITVLMDIGLGIGIDHGEVHRVHVGGDLTVVGSPVVYACRMAGAAPGSTLLNHAAYAMASGSAAGACEFREIELDVKHEGRTLAYEAMVRPDSRPALSPSWA